jgi:hypothetical protein
MPSDRLGGPAFAKELRIRSPRFGRAGPGLDSYAKVMPGRTIASPYQAGTRLNPLLQDLPSFSGDMAKGPQLPVRFFRRREQLRVWFEEHHSTAKEIWIGYYKRGVVKRGVTYAEAVEEALCFGWIDGQVRSIDESSYANRYSPRRPGSRWTQTNLQKAEELIRSGRMHPAGLEIYRQRQLGRRALIR